MRELQIQQEQDTTREINWGKVPREANVQVRDSIKEEWKDAYFGWKTYVTNAIYPFMVFSKEKGSKGSYFNQIEHYKYCRIAEEVEIPEEWYE